MKRIKYRSGESNLKNGPEGRENRNIDKILGNKNYKH